MTLPIDAYPDLLDGTPAPLLPTDVEPLNDADIAHIIWGHAWGFGEPWKTLFPAGWSPVDISSAVQSALWSQGVTRSLSRTATGVLIRALVEGVIIALPLDELDHSWVLMTAYPVCGEGVCRMTAASGLQPVPLNINELSRTLGL